MKKLTNKKGFTIVELVIVIAVIAILAAVLIPTFSSVIHNANASSCMQEIKSGYVEAYATVLSANGGNLPVKDEADTGKTTCQPDGSDYKYVFDNDGLASIEYTGSDYIDDYVVTVKANGEVTVTYDKDGGSFKSGSMSISSN